MAIIRFPPVEYADSYGLLAIGGDLEIESLKLAYENGIFPWPLEEEHLTWFAPPKRTVLFLDKVRISKSLAKERKREEYSFTINQHFEQVRDRSCEDEWISKNLIACHMVGNKLLNGCPTMLGVSGLLKWMHPMAGGDSLPLRF